MKRGIIGFINVTSGDVKCADPGYGTESGMTDIMKMKNGKYLVFLTEHDFGLYGVRNVELAIVHEDFADDYDTLPFEDAESYGSVDSGCFGFFDLKYYNETHDKNGPDEDWYQENVINTSHEDWVLTDERGVFASSGFGDGCYDLDILYEDQVDTKNETAVGARVIFIRDVENF